MSERRVSLCTLAIHDALDKMAEKEPELEDILTEEILEALAGMIKSTVSRMTCKKLGIKDV